MTTVQNFGLVFAKSNVIGICTSESYAQKCMIKLHNYHFIII